MTLVELCWLAEAVEWSPLWKVQLAPHGAYVPSPEAPHGAYVPSPVFSPQAPFLPCDAPPAPFAWSLYSLACLWHSPWKSRSHYTVSRFHGKYTAPTCNGDQICFTSLSPVLNSLRPEQSLGDWHPSVWPCGWWSCATGPELGNYKNFFKNIDGTQVLSLCASLSFNEKHATPMCYLISPPHPCLPASISFRLRIRNLYLR